MSYSYQALSHILKETHLSLERSADLDPNAPIVLDLKRLLLLKLAALEDEPFPLETNNTRQPLFTEDDLAGSRCHGRSLSL